MSKKCELPSSTLIFFMCRKFQFQKLFINFFLKIKNLLLFLFSLFNTQHTHIIYLLKNLSRREEDFFLFLRRTVRLVKYLSSFFFHKSLLCCVVTSTNQRRPFFFAARFLFRNSDANAEACGVVPRTSRTYSRISDESDNVMQKCTSVKSPLPLRILRSSWVAHRAMPSGNSFPPKSFAFVGLTLFCTAAWR